jgi:tetratricopeptide (TPR) repeat protein
MSFALHALVASLVVTAAPKTFPQSLPIVDNVARIDLGCKQMQEKHFAEAAATISELLAVSPNDAMALFRRGQCYYCIQKYVEAIKDFDAAIDNEPELSVFYLWRGTAHAKCSNDEQAIADYQRAMELDPILVRVVKQTKGEPKAASSKAGSSETAEKKAQTQSA